MYLKTLYAVRGRHQIARSRDVAEALGVKPGTVSGVLKKLSDLKLVDHERYGVVSLTPVGLRVAECLLRRFETIKDVLIEVFGVDAETAAEDACLMEHAVSPATAHRMNALLRSVRAGEVVIPSGDGARDDDGCGACESAGTCLAMTSGAA